MSHINQKASKHPLFPSVFRWSIVVLFLFGLIACASTPPADSTETPASEDKKAAPTETLEAKDGAMKNEMSNEASAKMAEPMTDSKSEMTSDMTPEAMPETMSEAMPDKTPKKMSASNPDEAKTVTTVASCKTEPYGKYEKQARDSMAKGLSATKEGKYGVGFRNIQEHKKWSDTHNQLFKSVNQACSTLSQCAQQHPKNKSKECATQAKMFNDWQNLAKLFAQNAKLSETTQPPKICTFTPSLEDAASCFISLGDNLDKACNSPDCKETSDCWRGIGFLDFAINQASSACNFARTPLAECRGYVTASKRRTAKFQRCSDMQAQLNVTVLPVFRMNNDY